MDIHDREIGLARKVIHAAHDILAPRDDKRGSRILPHRSMIARPPRALLLAAGFLTVATALWLAFFTTDRLTERDAYYFIQLGKQLHDGEGFTSRQIFPRNIPYFDQRNLLHDDSWPSLFRYPVAPMANAVGRFAFSDPLTGGVVQAGVFFLAGVPLFFLLAARFMPLGVASLATLVYLGTPSMWRTGYNGMTESSAILLLLGIFLLATRPAIRKGRWAAWLGLGCLCGLGYLIRNQLIFLLPLGVLLALTLDKHRLRSTSVFASAALATMSPWLIRNYLITGNPFFSFLTTRALLAKSGAFAGSIDLDLHAPVEMGAVLAVHGETIAAKIWRFFWPNLVDPAFWAHQIGLFAIFFPLLVAAFAIGDRTRKTAPTPEYLLFEKATLIYLATNFLLLCSTYHKPRYYEPAIPLLAIAVTRRLWWLAELGMRRFPGFARSGRAAALAMLFALAGLRFVSTLSEHAAFPPRDPSEVATYEVLRAALEPESITLSDLSIELTAHTGRRTIRAPRDPEQIFEIDRSYLPVDYLLFSQHLMRTRYRGFVGSEPLIRRYNFVTELPNGAWLYQRIGDRMQRVSTPAIQPLFRAATEHHERPIPISSGGRFEGRG